MVSEAALTLFQDCPKKFVDQRFKTFPKFHQFWHNQKHVPRQLQLIAVKGVDASAACRDTIANTVSNSGSIPSTL